MSAAVDPTAGILDALGPEELLVVVGPTASGKSELALRIAERAGGEIVNADSVQVYRGFDVGSGKPSPADLARVPHHLMSIVDPLDPIDAASWADLASATVREIRARGRVPVVCGGTFLWVRALVHGLAAMPAGDPAVRARHADEAARHGREVLHARLAAIDPAAAARISPNDLLRTSRALEVYELSGRPLSEWHALHAASPPRHAARFVGVGWSADALSARIAVRTAAFLASGWIEEVGALCAAGYADARAMGSVGYKQVLAHVRGELRESDLPLAIDRATRVFARRQRTWLRDEAITWIDPADLGWTG